MTRDTSQRDETASARDGMTVVAPSSISAPGAGPSVAGGREPHRIGQLLDRVLSRLALLALRTRLAHWSVVEPELWALRDALDDRHAHLDADVDAIADRMRALGVFPGGAVDSWQELAASADASTDGASMLDVLDELVGEDDRTLRLLRAAQERIGGDDDESLFLLARVEHDLRRLRWSLRTLCDALFTAPHELVLEQVA